jgi:hypothetical protein
MVSARVRPCPLDTRPGTPGGGDGFVPPRDVLHNGLFRNGKLHGAAAAAQHRHTVHAGEKLLARMLLNVSADWSRRRTRASIENPEARPGHCLMTNLRPLFPIVALVLLGGAAHAGEFSLGSTRMLAQAGADSNVDVTVNFADRGQALRETAEGGDTPATTTTQTARNLRGADTGAASAHRAATDAPAPKTTAPAPVTADSPHGVSISPSAALRRPSYRWQSLVPGTIK